MRSNLLARKDRAVRVGLILLPLKTTSLDSNSAKADSETLDFVTCQYVRDVP